VTASADLRQRKPPKTRFRFRFDEISCCSF
jgi:hypothetical protein